MKQPVAVMDLGTNTFHLLITDGDGNETVHKQVAVKLGEGGINKGFIVPEAFDRGLAAMQQFKALLVKHKVHRVRAIGTSAMRSAANGQDFIAKVEATTGITIEVISGDQEAYYIYRGVKASGALSEKNTLIMDIGGGSVEFIICNAEQIFWKHSFEIGAARLMEKFHQTDPIPNESILALNNYLETALKELSTAASQYAIHNLLGSSGVFETYLILIEQNSQSDLTKTKLYDFRLPELIDVTNKLISSTREERAANKTIIPVRIDMIVVASILARFVIRKLELTEVAMSTYSLKEGVLAEMRN